MVTMSKLVNLDKEVTISGVLLLLLFSQQQQRASNASAGDSQVGAGGGYDE